jgi:hypothetical protein
VTSTRLGQALTRERERFTAEFEREAELDRRRERLARLQQERLHAGFRKAERQLLAALGEREYEMNRMYGEFRTQSERLASDTINWDATPQRVRVSVKMLRAVCDKLPHGRYTVMASLFDHMGGHPLPMWRMQLPSMFGKQRRDHNETQCEQSTPIVFPADASHVNSTVEMHFDCDLHFVCPSSDAVRPSMCFVFELVLLTPGEDVVVGWGVFPLCNAEFKIVRGAFKTPMLRGPVDLSVDKHETFTRRYMQDVDNWLANLYFAVFPEDRITATGEREHETEIRHTSELLGHPSRDMSAVTHRAPARWHSILVWPVAHFLLYVSVVYLLSFALRRGGPARGRRRRR